MLFRRGGGGKRDISRESNSHFLHLMALCVPSPERGRMVKADITFPRFWIAFVIGKREKSEIFWHNGVLSNRRFERPLIQCPSSFRATHFRSDRIQRLLPLWLTFAVRIRGTCCLVKTFRVPTIISQHSLRATFNVDKPDAKAD